MKRFFTIILCALALLPALADTPSRVRVLSIGNSFARDAFAYVPFLIEELSPGTKVDFAILYIGGCSLERHYNGLVGELPDYELDTYRSEDGHWNMEKHVTLQKGVLSNDWDIIILQQQSAAARYYDTYQPYLDDLLKYLKEVRPRATTAWLMTQAYGTGFKRLKDMSTGSWAEYLVEVPKSDTYKVFMHLACKSGSMIDVYEDDQLVTTLQPTATSTTDFDTWGTQQFDVPLTAGKHRLKFYSNARLYYYEWLSIGEPTAVEQTAAQTLPAKCIENGQLLIHTNGRTYNAFGQAVD